MQKEAIKFNTIFDPESKELLITAYISGTKVVCCPPKEYTLAKARCIREYIRDSLREFLLKECTSVHIFTYLKEFNSLLCNHTADPVILAEWSKLYKLIRGET